ncbi:MAG TPA: dihydroorotate dehydrogenase-like protein [Planctomycetota bacterium]|nr:dihydroorotate dehydrogenase-like protein [Planctomycetota bacterium]
MDLSTPYLGLMLPHPLMPGASPMVDDMDLVRRLEDAGAAAIVMHSLFEEQIAGEQFARQYFVDAHAGAHPEAASYFPDPEEYALGPDEYLARIAKIKKAVRIPVIASLNGTTLGGWLGHAKLIQEAGADALELNVYTVATDPEERGFLIEERLVDILKAVKAAVRIPVAVKLSPYYTSLANLARHLEGAGADGLVLFNRFYQPDINAEELEVVRTLHLSDSSELLLRLRWLAILSGRVRPSLAVSGGVHDGLDAIKAVMCGAQAVQMVSALLRRGPEHLREVKTEMVAWMEKHDYVSLAQMRGSMSLARCPDPKAYERANYMHILQHWRGVVQPGESGRESWTE